MPQPSAIEVCGVSHAYGARQALDDVSLSVKAGEIFALLGPNGGGKSTLLRLICTLLPLQRGDVRVLGFDLREQLSAIRRGIGVVFQSPSLDKKLTVAENLLHQGHLYGLRGSALNQRRDELLNRFRLTDRAAERVEKLSGGLRRRVELAKALLHRPRLLLLDEPSTGLDPTARAELWQLLRDIRTSDGATIVLSTHLLDEADAADRLAILDRGRVVALDSPAALRATLGGESITIHTARPEQLAARISEQLHLPAKVVANRVRLESPHPAPIIAKLTEHCAAEIDSLTISKPTLADVFIARTGRLMEAEDALK